MTAERLYAALLLAYPATFRREYGDGMLEAFRQLHRAHRGSGVAFWMLLLNDTARSVFSTQIDDCRTGLRRFFLEWAATCASGAIVTALLANALTFAFGYFYHPYLEGVTVPAWSYGALLGVALGVGQTTVLRTRFRLGLPWVIASGVGAAIGLEAAIATAKIAGPAGYGIVLGAIVGGVQWAVLRTRVREAAWWGLASSIALSAVMFSCAISLHTTLAGLNAISHNPLAAEPEARNAALTFLARGLYQPTTSGDLAIEFAVMAMCGLVIAVLTARPLSSIYAHQDRARR
jgi:hypothetical protein